MYISSNPIDDAYFSINDVGWARKGLFSGRNVSKYLTFRSGFLHAISRHKLQSFPPVQDMAVPMGVHIPPPRFSMLTVLPERKVTLGEPLSTSAM